MKRKRTKRPEAEKEYTPFPPANQHPPSKLDLQLESGEYFLSEQERDAQRRQQKKDQSAQARDDKRRAREQEFVAPKVRRAGPNPPRAARADVACAQEGTPSKPRPAPAAGGDGAESDGGDEQPRKRSRKQGKGAPTHVDEATAAVREMRDRLVAGAAAGKQASSDFPARGARGKKAGKKHAEA